MSLTQNYHLLINAIASMDEIVSIGKSGGAELPENNESDIDLFVFCNHSPDTKARETVVKNSGASISSMTLSETKGRFWGICDFVFLDETEICLMYFDISDVNNDIASILKRYTA